MRIGFLAAGSLALLAVATTSMATSHRVQDGIIGIWRLREVKMTNKGAKPLSPDVLASMRSGSKLELRADKTFKLTISNSPTEGTWTAQNGTVLMAMRTMNGRPVSAFREDLLKFAKDNPSVSVKDSLAALDKPMIGAVSGGLMTLVQSKGSPMQFVFVRS